MKLAQLTPLTGNEQPTINAPRHSLFCDGIGLGNPAQADEIDTFACTLRHTHARRVCYLVSHQHSNAPWIVVLAVVGLDSFC